MDYSCLGPYYTIREMRGNFVGIMILSSSLSEAEKHFEKIVEGKIMDIGDRFEFFNSRSSISDIVRNDVMHFFENDS